MIIDTFIFNNEIDILKARLDYLKNHVDIFLIVESNTTFTGIKKNFILNKFINNNYKHLRSRIFVYENFKEVKDLSDIFSDWFPFSINSNAAKKIIDLNKKTSLNKSIALNETYQRELISIAINKFTINKDNIIILSDVDEIPNEAFIKEIKNINSNTLNYAQMNQYYYSMHYQSREKWIGSVALRQILIEEFSIYYLRFMIKHFEKFDIKHKIIRNSGWHFTSFGDQEMIKNKISSWGHWEFNTFLNRKLLNYRLNRCFDIFGRNKKIFYSKNIYSIPNEIKKHFLKRQYLNKFIKPNKFDYIFNTLIIFTDKIIRKVKIILKIQ